VKTDDSCFHTAFETDNNRKRCVCVCVCVCVYVNDTRESHTLTNGWSERGNKMSVTD